MGRARPYEILALLYDQLLGDRFFRELRHRFEKVALRFRVPIRSAADVACGTGIFVRYLCARGAHSVYGVDSSAAMLRAAMAKVAPDCARFFHQDFLSVQLPQPVNLITCNFDSLNYLLDPQELTTAIRRFHSNLRPGGHVIFDMITDRIGLGAGTRRGESVAGRGFRVARTMHWNPATECLTSRIVLSWPGSSIVEKHVQRGYPISSVTRSLNQSGFTLLGVFDFSALKSPTWATTRAIYVAARR